MLTPEAQKIKEAVQAKFEETKTFPYQSPLGTLHAVGIKEGEQLAFSWVLKFIKDMEDQC